MYYFKIRKTMEWRGGAEVSATEETSLPGIRNQLGTPFLVKAKAGCLEN